MRAIAVSFVALALAACQSAGEPRSSSDGAPQRIVARTVLADEVLWQLGPEVRSRVVSVSIMADDPRYSTVVGKWPASVSRTTGAGESLVALEPDLVIVGGFTNQDVRSLLRGAGIETLVTERLGGFDDFRANVRMIAAAAHAIDEGEALIARFDARLATLRREPPATPLAIVSWSEGIVAGNRTTFADASDWVGLRNLPAFHGLTRHKRITLEQMVAWDPEVIVISCDPERCAETSRAFGARVGIGGTRAGKAGRILAIEHRILTSTGMGMLDLVAELGRLAAAR